MAIFHNPALHQESRNHTPEIPPQVMKEPLLTWLERVGRLKPNTGDNTQNDKASEELDEILDLENYTSTHHHEEEE